MILALDFETTYSTDYSLSKISTEAYIRDPRFEVIGVGVSVNGAPACWHAGRDVEPALRALPWGRASLLAYNTVFDGAILAWTYGIRPALYLDAMGMAKALHKTYNGAGLLKVARTMGLGEKGDYVAKVRGMRLADFEPLELAQYGKYCCQDVDLTVKIYKELAPHFPKSEVLVQDRNLRLFIEPLLQFDVPALERYHEEVVGEKWRRLVSVAGLLGMDWGSVELPTDNAVLQTYDQLDGGKLIAAMKRELASNPRFAIALQAVGVDPPQKLSPTTGKLTWAFAKTDPEFMELQEDDNPDVRALVSARLGIKSTIEETRAKRFLDIATRGAWPVQYLYYGADTSRFSGAGNANPQNLKRGGSLRDAILPPPGHAIMPADLGQIECRMVNYLSMQDDIINAFKLSDQGLGPDVYCILAEKIFRCPVTPADKDKRMPGKVGELLLGFGGGRMAFKRTLFKEAGMHWPEHECQAVVDIYRSSHKMVQALWKQGDVVLESMIRGLPFELGRAGMLDGSDPSKGIGLPNGLHLYYPELRSQWNKEKKEWEYAYTKKGKPVTIYGAVVVQNCVEALSRLVLTDAWLRIAERVRVVLHSHDELSGVVPFRDVDWAQDFMHAEMTRPVPWAPGLPLNCEVGVGRTYGGAKK